VLCKTGHPESAKPFKLQDIENLHDVTKFCMRGTQTLIVKYKRHKR
jgi:hypothetical protein